MIYRAALFTVAPPMRTIELDATNWKTVLDFCEALRAALGSPEGHGDSIDAFIDSMVYGGMNAVEAPYVVRIRGVSQVANEIREYIELLQGSLPKPAPSSPDVPRLEIIL